MTIRFRAASVASMALVFGLGAAAAGCGKYSYSNLKAVKAFKDGNALYQQKDYKRAAERYEAAPPDDRTRTSRQAYFFLANSYDEQYKPAKAGRRHRTTPTSRRPSTTTRRPPSEIPTRR